jgi:DNA-binding response OmpR family regulator
VHRHLAVTTADFARWDLMPDPPVSTLVIVDVHEDALAAAERLLDRRCDAAPAPWTIAFAWPHRVSRLAGKADAVIAKPFAIDTLLAALDRLAGGYRPN